MPFAVPTLSDLRAQARANFSARIAGADTLLARAVIPVVADVIAYCSYAAYRGIAWVARQLFIASAEAPYLDRRLGEVSLTRIPAATAAGNVVFTGAAGTPIPLGTLVQTQDQAWSYATTSAGTVGSGGTISVPTLAQTAGSGGNLLAGTIVVLVGAIASVQPTATVDTAGIVGGTDAETDAAFRVRGAARLAQPPQGGAASDFLAWAKASGIPTRAWVYPQNRGPGTCDVTFVIDTRANNIPLTADITAVLDYMTPLEPVIGEYQVFAPTPDTLAVTIHGLIGNGGITQTALQAAVTAQLQALVAAVPPGGPTSGPTAMTGDGVSAPLAPGALFPTMTPGTLFLDQIEAAIEAAGNVQSYDLTAPAADVTFATGHLPGALTVTFT